MIRISVNIAALLQRERHLCRYAERLQGLGRPVPPGARAEGEALRWVLGELARIHPRLFSGALLRAPRAVRSPMVGAPIGVDTEAQP